LTFTLLTLEGAHVLAETLETRQDLVFIFLEPQGGAIVLACCSRWNALSSTRC